MDLYKLKSFYTVAKLESFSRAADILYLSQPAVSAQIKDLESVYKVKLFERVGRNIKLTRSGTELLKYVEHILKIYEESHLAIDLLKDAKNGNINLNVSELPGITLLPTLMSSFKTEYPEVTFTLNTDKSAEIIDSVKKNHYDLGFIINSQPAIKNDDLDSRLLHKDRIVLAVSKKHPLAMQNRINVKDLSSLSLIVSQKDTVSRQALDELFRTISIPFRIAYEINSKSMTKSMVEENLGVALLSSLEIEKELEAGEINILEIDGISLYRYIHVICHKSREMSPTVRAFYDFILNPENMDIRQPS